ncbi:hypothetical protein D3C78_388830 [compost metagenome]
MSVPPIIQYPLDLKGNSPTNKIVGERREISTNSERVFVPKAGPFYTESFVLINDDTGEPLVPVDDYVLAQPFSQASLRSGKDVQCAVVIKLQAPIAVRMDYQVVGGEYSWNLGALAALIEELDLDERPIKWGSIVGRPTMYPPAPHIHDIGDSYGWEYVVWQLERITNAILVGDEASHDELRQQMQFIRDQLQANIDAVDDKVDLHLNDFNNPHKTTKAQVGLGSVENYGIATSAEALAGVINTKYMTPSLVAVLAARLADEAVDTHIADKNNPHNTTKAQVGLGSVDNFPTATQAQAEAGTAVNAFMTPLRTYQAIMVHAGTLIQNHVNDKNNPHNTTKAQVGLSLVDNFQTASQAEAVAGTLNTRFMTPLRVKEAINAIAGDLINAHVANLNNPHQTTKAQVGLGNLPNAITRSRALNSDAYLLTAGGMYDHVQSGDHDARYVKINVSQNTSLRVVGSTLQGYVSGAWRQLWPATWTGHVAIGANDPNLGSDPAIALLNAGGVLYASVNSVWRQVWPPLWTD